MAQAFLVNFPFLFWFNNLNHFRMIFPKTREIEEPCRETVRNDKKSWDSRQNRERWQVCDCESVYCNFDTSNSKTKFQIPKTLSDWD